MTSSPEESIQTGDRLPNLDLPRDHRWHEGGRTVSLRAGPRRAALLLYLPHGAAEVGGEDEARSSPCGPCRSFIEDLMGASDTITLKGGTIAIASPEGRRMLEERVGFGDTNAHLIVTDRFGEVWDVRSVLAVDDGTDDGARDDADSRTDVHEDLPPTPELVEWVDYLGTQCPECGVLDTTDRSWRTI